MSNDKVIEEVLNNRDLYVDTRKVLDLTLGRGIEWTSDEKAAQTESLKEAIKGPKEPAALQVDTILKSMAMTEQRMFPAHKLILPRPTSHRLVSLSATLLLIFSSKHSISFYVGMNSKESSAVLVKQ